jgi:putative N6-adenine-specific DNA methylase
LPRAAAPITASDRDAGAIDAARANATRAGVESDVSFAVAPISALEPPRGHGWLISNQPYGVRVGERDRLRNLYAQLGNVSRAKLLGWTVGFLLADRRLESQIGLDLREVFATRNGGIPVRMMVGAVGEATAR